MLRQKVKHTAHRLRKSLYDLRDIVYHALPKLPHHLLGGCEHLRGPFLEIADKLPDQCSGLLHGTAESVLLERLHNAQHTS